MVKVIKDKEILKKMSKRFNKKIEEVQVWNNSHVLCFSHNFWWFKHRYRISYKEYMNIFESYNYNI